MRNIVQQMARENHPSIPEAASWPQIWENVKTEFQQRNLNTAYLLIISELMSPLSPDQEDLGLVYLVRLMGQTGVCVTSLTDHTMHGLIDICVQAL